MPLQGWEYTEANFFRNLGSFFRFGLLIAGIAVFMSDMVSGECTPATLKFLLVQPVKRGKILFSKFIVSLVTVTSLIVLPQLAGMAIVNITSNTEVSNLTSILLLSEGLYSFLSNSNSIFSSNGDNVSVRKASWVASTVL